MCAELVRVRVQFFRSEEGCCFRSEEMLGSNAATTAEAMLMMKPKPSGAEKMIHWPHTLREVCFFL